MKNQTEKRRKDNKTLSQKNHAYLQKLNLEILSVTFRILHFLKACILNLTEPHQPTTHYYDSPVTSKPKPLEHEEE
jgi:hypothetical protein